MAMKKVLPALQNERGSVLLISIVLVVVMTLLGLALFDLAAIENTMSLANQSDAQAFEIAQAGVERALERLRRTFETEAVTPGPDLVPSWRDGDGAASAAICTGGCDTTINSTVRAFRSASSTYLPNTSFGGGSYVVSFRLLTRREARGAETFAWPNFAQTCGVPNDDDLCTDLIWVRSTGTLTGGPPGYPAVRTVQVLAKATTSSGLFTAITAGSQTQAISGNVNIAGSINVIETPASATQAWQFKGGADQQNNWSGLPNSITDRLKPLALVCPPGRDCTGGTGFVESLGAVLSIQRPLDKRAVDINSGSANVGTSGDSGTYGSGTAFNPFRKGKGPIDGVYIADGCVMPCTQNGSYVPGDPGSIGSFTGNTDRVWVDDNNITRPYPSASITAYPQLTDPAAINGVSYAHYACPAGSSCAGITGGTLEFFVSHARDPVLLTDWTASLAGNIGSGGGLTPTTPLFTITRTFTNRAGVITVGQICWKRLGTPVLEFGSPLCTTYTSAQNPLLIYTTGTFRIDGDIQYSGAAIFLVAPASASGVVLNNNITTACVTVGGDPCGRKFVNDPSSPTTTDMLAVLTTGAVGNGNVSIDGHNGDTIMTSLYAGVPSAFASGGLMTISKQLNLVGSIMATAINFVNVPNFFLVPGTAPDLVFGTSSPWRIQMIPGSWRICQPGATPTSPATPTTPCGYN
jgi:hypothetical protein